MTRAISGSDAMGNEPHILDDAQGTSASGKVLDRSTCRVENKNESSLEGHT